MQNAFSKLLENYFLVGICNMFGFQRLFEINSDFFNNRGMVKGYNGVRTILRNFLMIFLKLPLLNHGVLGAHDVGMRHSHSENSTLKFQKSHTTIYYLPDTYAAK